jgi:uncharacterized protein YprB with RNaseH-like and TPR domain
VNKEFGNRKTAADSLTSRLKAYRPAGKSKEKNYITPRTTSTFTEVFLNHPLTGSLLDFPESIALDFAENCSAKELLFFDLESTGLGSAEETYPFLIGAGTSLNNGIELSLFFAESPADEADILRTFVDLAQEKTLVTFNGKSFDWPLVARRAKRYGITIGSAGKRHVDLYHLIRRIYPEKPSRLMDAESRLLGFTREGDVRGAEVAQSYYEYLHLGRTEVKDRILHHNKIDVLSLVSLLQMVSTAFVTGRAGVTGWAYKLHRHKSASTPQAREILLQHGVASLDARDLDQLGETYRKEKKYHTAARFALMSYRKGFPAAVLRAVRNLRRLSGKKESAARIARYALAREDERIQRQLLPYVR